MPKLHLSKSTIINAPVEQVYERISNLSHWSAWSPWLITEPEATVTVADDHKSYSWEGKRVGSGNMKVTSEQTNQSVDYDLTFLTPWKSHADVRFEVKPKDGSTEVTWFMDSSLPFFMFWMKKMMIALIGMDYERGLALLKDYVEDGKVHSQLEFKGEGNYPGCTYIALKRETTVAAVGTDMEADFSKLWEAVGDQKELIAGEAFSIYHKWDLVKGKVSYTSGIPVSRIPESLAPDMITGELPQMKTYTLRHIGPYLHLGNAWTTIQMMLRGKEFKAVKGAHPFETYVNSPSEVPQNELITDIHFAVR